MVHFSRTTKKSSWMISLSWFDGRGAIVLAAFHQCALWTKSVLEAAIFEQSMCFEISFSLSKWGFKFHRFWNWFTVYFIDISTYICKPKKYIFSWEEIKKTSHTNSIFIIPPLKINANFSSIFYYLVDKIAKFDKYLWIFSAFLEIW